MKLTPEERKRLKQEKKLAKKLELERSKRQVKRDYLERERKYGELNRKKLERLLKRQQMEITVPYLKQEFDFAVNQIEIMIDIKDFQISLLLDELNDFEELHRMNFSKSTENTEHILDTYDLRLDELRKNYLTEYNIFLKESQIKKLKDTTKIDIDQNYLKTIIFHLEHDATEFDTFSLIQNISKLEETRHENATKTQVLTSKKEEKFENIWKQYKQVLKNHLKDEAKMNKHCLPLWDSINFNGIIIKQQFLQIYELKKNKFRLKDRQINNKEDTDNYIQFRREERNYFKEQFNYLKHCYDSERNFDQKHLTFLVLTSNACIKNLEHQAKNSEAVMKMYSVIRKLETQHEKILPFPKEAPIILEKFRAAHDAQYIIKNEVKLQPFWLKCGQSDSLRHSIHEESKYLREENSYLKKVLNKYCAAMKNSCLSPYKRKFKKG